MDTATMLGGIVSILTIPLWISLAFLAIAIPFWIVGRVSKLVRHLIKGEASE